MRRWELELRPDLDALGVAWVALCADTPEEIRAGRHRHGAGALLLADPDLAVTGRLGLRNEVSLTPRGVRPLPIPTTILVDAEGVVRWIDVARDFRIRSNPQRVRAALRAALGADAERGPGPRSGGA